MTNGSFVSPEEEAKKEAAEKAAKEAKAKQGKTGTSEGIVETPNPPKQETIFSYLDRIATAVENNTKAIEEATKTSKLTYDTLRKVVTSLERMVFEVKVEEAKKAVEKKASTPEKKVESEAKSPIKVVVEKPKKVEKQKSTKQTNTIQIVKNAFTKELADLLIFEEEDDYIKIRTKAFLTGDNFPKVAAVVRNIGGEYISAGKNTHFRVKKTA